MAMTLEQTRLKIEELQNRHSAVIAKKNSLGGQLQAKKEELAALIKEIRDAGYDPKKLVSERDKVQGELEEMIQEFDRNLTEVEKALSVYDKK